MIKICGAFPHANITTLSTNLSGDVTDRCDIATHNTAPSATETHTRTRTTPAPSLPDVMRNVAIMAALVASGTAQLLDVQPRQTILTPTQTHTLVRSNVSWSDSVDIVG